MHLCIIVAIAALLCTQGVAAQEISLAATPRVRTKGSGQLAYSIAVMSAGDFRNSIYFRARCATLPGAVFTFDPKVLSYPYDVPTTLTVAVEGAWLEGTHSIVVEAYNGPLSVIDTCTLVVPDDSAWEVYTTANSGIAGNQVMAIAHDRKGQAWLATDRGVSRFDGTTWTTFVHGIWEGHQTDHIAVDLADTVWVISVGDLYKLGDGKWIRQELPDIDGTDRALDVHASPDGSVWVLLYGGIPARYRNGTWEVFEEHAAEGASWYTTMGVDARGRVWVTDEYGAECYDGTYWMHYDFAGMGWQRFVATDITADANGTVWMFGGGVMKIGDVDTTYRSSPRGWVLAIDPTGLLWSSSGDGLGPYDAGLQVSSADSNVPHIDYTHDNSPMPGGPVHDIVIGRGRTVWVGTDAGLVVVNAAALFPAPVKKDVHAGRIAYMQGLAPNPAGDMAYVNVSLSEPRRLRLAVYDALGMERLVLEDTFMPPGVYGYAIATEALLPGSYIVHLTAGDATDTRSIVVFR